MTKCFPTLIYYIAAFFTSSRAKRQNWRRRLALLSAAAIIKKERENVNGATVNFNLNNLTLIPKHNMKLANKRP